MMDDDQIDWRDLPPTLKLQAANHLLESPAGKWAVSLALHYALLIMKRAPKRERMQETMDDMELLRSTIVNSPCQGRTTAYNAQGKLVSDITYDLELPERTTATHRSPVIRRRAKRERLTKNWQTTT
ncbi:MAG: hypothetical protein H0W86_09475 [Armatimonadetes bacterium]|nr:hypothetical protein [Armatimonadota bacterium]